MGKIRRSTSLWTLALLFLRLGTTAFGGPAEFEERWSQPWEYFCRHFLFVAASGPLVPRIRRSPIAGAFLDGVNVAALALMAVVTYQLGRAALIDVKTIIIALVSGIIFFCFGSIPRG